MGVASHSDSMYDSEKPRSENLGNVIAKETILEGKERYVQENTKPK